VRFFGLDARGRLKIAAADVRPEREAEVIGGPLQRLRLLRQQFEDTLERAIYCLRKLEDAAVAIVRVDRIDEC
jgi:hypothetical protein